MSDRILGAFLLVVALGYAWITSSFQVGFISDPLGPKPFPYGIAAGLALSSLWLLLKPDPNPAWPTRGFWITFWAVLLSLVAYAYLIVPLGFVLTTTLEMTALSALFGARWVYGLLGGLAFSVAVYLLFTQALNVPLPIGRIFGG